MAVLPTEPEVSVEESSNDVSLEDFEVFDIDDPNILAVHSINVC